MKFLGLLIALGASLVSSAPAPVQVSTYIAPSTYPAYYVYDYLPVDQSSGLPIAVQPFYNYYGVPFYNYVYVNQLYPGYPAYQPSLIPVQRPIYPVTTQKPILDVDDGIEKLDEKVEPSQESTPHPNDDEDTVTIDAV